MIGPRSFVSLVLALLVNSSAEAQSTVQRTVDQYISSCTTNYQLVITSLKFSMRDAKDPAADRLSELDQGQFCKCLGTKNHDMLSKGNVGASSDVATMNTKNGAECAQNQLGLAKAPAVHIQPMNPPVSEAFKKFFSSDFQTAKGLGGLVINGAGSTVTQLLGKPERSFKSKDSEELIYGPNLIDCNIQIKGGLIKSIKVGRTYKGKTDKGIRIGDSYEVVKQKHGTVKPLIDESRKTLLYEDGTLYQFRNTKEAELNSIAVVTAEAYWPMELALKNKKK